MTVTTMGSRMHTGTTVGVINANTTVGVASRMGAERASESPFHFSLRDPRTPNDQRQPAAYLAARLPAGRSVSCRGRSIPAMNHRTWQLALGKRSVGK
jgi:hypothetical protein